MTKNVKAILTVFLIAFILMNTGCSLSKKKAVETQGQTAQQTEDSSIKKFLTDYLEQLYSKPLPVYETYSLSGSIPSELWDYISKDTLSLSDGNPDNRINLPRPVIINNLVLGNYEMVKGDSETPQIDCQFVGKTNDVSTYLLKVNLKAKCISINDLMNIIKSSLDAKTIANVQKASTENDYSGLNDIVLNLLKQKTFGEMSKEVDATNKLDYIKVQIAYEAEIRKEDGKNKIVSFQEAEKLRGYKNRLSMLNNVPVTRLPYLDTSTSKSDLDTYTKESMLITDYFNKLFSSLDNEKMELMAMYWNTSNQKFTEYLDKIGKSTDGKAKSLTDMMAINGDYKLKFAYDSFPILLNMEKINGVLNSISIKMHPVYSEKRKTYLVSFQAPVQKINGSVEGYTSTCYYDYTVTLTGKDDKLKISSMSMNEHYYLN